MKKITPFLVGLTILLGAGACQNLERTSADAPSSPDGAVEEPAQVEETNADARDETRRAQLDSDIRAREERTNAVGNAEDRSDDDLASEVRSKLEANIPQGKLAVTSEEGVVSVTGTVPNQQEYDSIATLAQEIRGVKQVKVDAQIVAPAETPAPADQ
ncbi:BON domain-containing protein [Laspinema sp. A4]|uniref:BON domain-containing protein n=1 Tax=Laspinema sp. D2d TaxID=2953686 RepID=UPI0021BB98A4|nr:BON domain-containing protein [Laspinema sp. D2d]MCT7983943.1 BON domain-containing protein [Laspinema sp. D2d]